MDGFGAGFVVSERCVLLRTWGGSVQEKGIASGRRGWTENACMINPGQGWNVAVKDVPECEERFKEACWPAIGRDGHDARSCSRMCHVHERCVVGGGDILSSCFSELWCAVLLMVLWYAKQALVPPRATTVVLVL